MRQVSQNPTALARRTKWQGATATLFPSPLNWLTPSITGATTAMTPRVADRAKSRAPLTAYVVSYKWSYARPGAVTAADVPCRDI